MMNEIAIIAQLASRLFERVMPAGMTMPQFAVLNHFVRLRQPSTPVRLAGAFQVTKSAMTNTLQHLEQRGLVAIAGHPTDGRAKMVMITEAGRAAHRAAVDALAPTLQRLASAVPAAGVEALLPTLVEVRRYLDQERDAPR